MLSTGSLSDGKVPSFQCLFPVLYHSSILVRVILTLSPLSVHFPNFSGFTCHWLMSRVLGQLHTAILSYEFAPSYTCWSNKLVYDMKFAVCKLNRRQRAKNVISIGWSVDIGRSSSHAVGRSPQISDTVRILSQVTFGHKVQHWPSLNPSHSAKQDHHFRAKTKDMDMFLSQWLFFFEDGRKVCSQPSPLCPPQSVLLPSLLLIHVLLVSCPLCIEFPVLPRYLLSTCMSSLLSLLLVSAKFVLF